MRWFRMHADAVDDDKLKLLAFEDRWHFVAIMCLKAQGVLDDSQHLDRRVAAKLGLTQRDADEVRNRLMDIDLVDDNWQPINWDKRQYVSDNSTERVRRYRQKQQLERLGNVSGTSPETETETETQRESDDSHGGETPPDPVRSVFDYWVYVMGKDPNRTKLSPDRRRKIQSRLKEYSVDECCRAIDGCASSDFHMGRHSDSRGKQYNGIDLIFRNGEKLEGFRDMAEGAQRATEGANAPPEFPD